MLFLKPQLTKDLQSTESEEEIDPVGYWTEIHRWDRECFERSQDQRIWGRIHSDMRLSLFNDIWYKLSSSSS
jgi:hypothetical protein